MNLHSVVLQLFLTEGIMIETMELFLSHFQCDHLTFDFVIRYINMQRLMHRDFLFYTLDGFGFGVINPHKNAWNISIAWWKSLICIFGNCGRTICCILFLFFFLLCVIYNAKLSGFKCCVCNLKLWVIVGLWEYKFMHYIRKNIVVANIGWPRMMLLTVFFFILVFKH